MGNTLAALRSRHIRAQRRRHYREIHASASNAREHIETAFAGDPKLDILKRLAVRAAVRCADRRLATYLEVRTLTVLPVIITIAAAIQMFTQSGPLPQVALMATYVPMLTAATRLIRVWPWTIGGERITTSVALSPVCLGLAGRVSDTKHLIQQRPADVGEAYEIIVVSMVVALTLARWAPTVRPHVHHVADDVFVTLIRAADHTAAVHRGMWMSPQYNQRLRWYLRRAAYQAGQTFQPRVPLSEYDWPARKSAVQASARLAWIIESRARRVVDAADKDVYGDLHEWLRDGIRKWAFGGLDEVIRAAPLPARTGRLAQWLRRLLPTAVLVAAGVVVPLLPQVARQAGAADDVRITLLTAAALFASVGPGPAADQVMAVVGKVGGFKGGS